jgi:hypothetical protein
VRVWKTECAPLMIQQTGCISGKLLRCRDAHEFISYSEWNSEADIAAYTNGALTNRSFATPALSKGPSGRTGAVMGVRALSGDLDKLLLPNTIWHGIGLWISIRIHLCHSRANSSDLSCVR